MDLNYPILQQLRRLDGPAVDDALLGAIELSEPSDQAPLADLLLERGQPRGLAGLIGRYHALSPALRGRLRSQAVALSGGLRPSVASPSRQTRMNVLELIVNGREPTLAYLAALALGDSDRVIADRAADALRNAVERFLSKAQPPRPVPASRDDDPGVRERYAAWSEDRRELVQAVRLALANFEAHQRPAVLDCAIWLTDELGDVLRPMLDQPRNRTGVALQEQVSQSARLGRSAVPFIYLALSVPTIRNRFAGRIGRMRDRGIVSELIGQVDRAADPEVARGLAAVKRMSFFDQPGWWEQLPDPLAEAAVRWISAIGADTGQKVPWLMNLILDGSSAQRAAGMDHLCQWQNDEATVALKRLLDSDDGDLAGRAANELIQRGCPGLDELMLNRLTHPDERLRQLARDQVARVSFDRFWAQYPKLAEEVRKFAAGKLRRLVDDLPERLVGKMASADPAQRLQAVRVADLCGIADGVKEALFARCLDPDAKVRSAVVKLLGQVPGAQSERLATAALEDADRRVRANAVEALESLRSETEAGAVELGEMLDDPDNRIRANAIKAVMDVDVVTARDKLAQMLADPSADHRLSALWVLEQVKWFKPAEHVLRLAQQDPDRRVRRRALRTLGQLRRMYRQAVPRRAARARAGAGGEVSAPAVQETAE